jgi:hypothetical protein
MGRPGEKRAIKQDFKSPISKGWIGACLLPFHSHRPTRCVEHAGYRQVFTGYGIFGRAALRHCCCWMSREFDASWAVG